MEEIIDLFDLLEDDDTEEQEFIYFGLPRQIYNRSDYINSFDEVAFKQRFRLNKEAVLLVLMLIEADLEYPMDVNQSVSPINQLLTFLRFCATGKNLLSVADFMECHLSTVSRIVCRVAIVISLRCKHFVHMPKQNTEMATAAKYFYKIAKFPRVIGVIDCTHVKIQSLGGTEAEIFRNRKGYFSMNVQAICQSNLSISNIVARWPGSAHDSTIFNNSRVHAELESGSYLNYVLLGDSGYAVSRYLMTPMLNPRNPNEQLYNESHIRTRNIIERCFGVLKRRFPVLAYGIRLKKVDTIMDVIVATSILHNVAISFKDEVPGIDSDEDPLDFNELVNDDDPNRNEQNNQNQGNDLGTKD